MSAPIKVLCMEDNELVADAIGRKLKRDERFEWLGWVSTGPALASAVVERKPHVVCMDLDIPGQNTVDIIRDLRNHNPGTRVLVLTGHLREDFVNQTIDAGAWGYVSKAEESRVIVDSIHRVAKGEFVLGKLTLAECGSVPRPPAS
ncbi:MAG: response regulator transcription factor [Phycisphaerales bacterium]